MENLSGGQGFLLLHQHLRHMDWSKITPEVTQPEYLILTALSTGRPNRTVRGSMCPLWQRS